MRVLIDTNVIISAMIFKSSNMIDILLHVTEQHELCIAAYSIEEAKRILKDKFSSANGDIDRFFMDYPYTLIDPVPDSGAPLAKIRDEKDYPVLYAAITGQIDVLVTGDNDFFEVKVDRPEIVHPQDYLLRYKQGC
ncbi:MAG: putative toxin-antitoxin system toxin component, PIN family [Coriobacteriales bacterium]|jgi:putative PIN family toxin of toxin-antitoxin system|nr:putative toxin-antitoxin system toxin component, PIN family [Coriobacteriales bacterium]